MQAPVLVKPIPMQVINELAAYGPFDLNDFIQSPDGGPLQFQAELKDGSALPKGMICTSDGILTGIPAKQTQGNYEVMLSAQNEAGIVQAEFVMTIKPSFAGGEYIDKLKAQIWEALEQNLPIPEFTELYDRPITLADIYYLLERWGVLTIWDAFNLDPPDTKTLITLPGVSPHYNVFDKGSCIMCAPKDLYSHERTLIDGIMTAQAMAREVYKRGWTVELTGFEKLTRAAWVEIQHLSDIYGHRLEVINYTASPRDVQLYSSQALSGSRYDME